jgi:hypothetical protein
VLVGAKQSHGECVKETDLVDLFRSFAKLQGGDTEDVNVHSMSVFTRAASGATGDDEGGR